MAAPSSAPIPATLIPGDGIGPEITDAVVEILNALGAPFAWDTQAGGMAAVGQSADPLPAALLESIRRTRLALKGPLTTPVGGGFRSVAPAGPKTSRRPRSSSPPTIPVG